ncbi:MAG TPA: type II secretion system protein [Kofleriaceae bacterium]|jgi:general secretion pathway protein I
MTVRIRGRAFTLLEVMVGLMILAVALVVVLKSAANNIYNAQQARMIGVATDLARGKMYELEEHLIKDGFQDMEEHQEDQKFTDEGWPSVTYSYHIIPVELPNWDILQQMAKGKYLAVAGCGSGGAGIGVLGSGAGCGSGSGSSAPGSGYQILTQQAIAKLSPEEKAQLQAQYGSDYGFGSAGSGSGSGSFQDSILGMMLSQYGGLGGQGDAAGANGNALVQAYYTQFQQILKVSIRKVQLTVKWKVGGDDRDMTVVAYFTDSAAMDQVLSGMGSTDITPDGGSGSGSSTTGSNSRGTTGSNKTIGIGK